MFLDVQYTHNEKVVDVLNINEHPSEIRLKIYIPVYIYSYGFTICGLSKM
jgi:hypothetical protein